MIKALFLDLDETLCDTSKANSLALTEMATCFESILGNNANGEKLAEYYRQGIYRELAPELTAKLSQSANEEQFRHNLIAYLIEQAGFQTPEANVIKQLQESFDEARTRYFDFFPGIAALLTKLRKQFTLVVITNGPEFSQVVKVERVNLKDYVDHIIIGGQEPEQKPAVSIFEKALRLADCHKSEAIHFGDSLSCDVQGANNAGIRAVWIRHGQSVCSMTGKPDDVIEHPSDIPLFIQQHIQAAL